MAWVIQHEERWIRAVAPLCVLQASRDMLLGYSTFPCLEQGWAWKRPGWSWSMHSSTLRSTRCKSRVLNAYSRTSLVASEPNPAPSMEMSNIPIAYLARLSDAVTVSPRGADAPLFMLDYPRQRVGLNRLIPGFRVLKRVWRKIPRISAVHADDLRMAAAREAVANVPRHWRSQYYPRSP